MDLRQAIISALYMRLTEDGSLQAACGGTVRMAYHMAQPDTPFPYLTHRLVLEAGESWALANGIWYLDLWDHGPDMERLLAMRHRVITLMDWLILQPAGGEAVALQVGFVRDEGGPTDAADVHRLMIQWDLHLDRQVEVEAILSR